MKKFKGTLMIILMVLSLLPLVAPAAVPGFNLNDSFDIYKGKPPGKGGGGEVPQVEDWGYARIGAAFARSQTTGTVQVAVLDTGVDTSHPDLAGVVTWCFSGIKRGNYDCSDRNVKDDDGHGTHVTGTIAALDNSIDSVGVAAGHVEIYSGKVLGKRGGSWDDLAWSIMHATDGPDGILGTADDAEVISMSLGGDISSSPSTIAMLQDAIDYATSNGVAVVAAAGNEGTCEAGDVQHSWPAENAGVFTVGATGIYDGTNFVTEWTGAEQDVMPCFSNDMPAGVVDISAPGVYITATKRGGGVTDLSGTSMATPHVAAVIALLMANGLSATQAQNRIVATALDMGYPSTMQGAGLMLADAAI